MSLSAVILAGGKSSRMGRDKALLPFGGYSTLAEYQYRKLEPLFDKVYISSKEDKFPFDVDIIYDKYSDSTPLNAIVSTLETIDTDAIFLLSVDMPLLSINTIKSLVELYRANGSEYSIYSIESSRGIEPTATIYRKTIYGKAKRLLDNRVYKLKSLIERFKLATIEVNSENELLNMNMICDYKNALKNL